MSETSWYYVEGSERIGPVEESKIQELFSLGSLTTDSYVWCKGFDDWQKISDTVELEFLLEENSEPLPPVMDTMPPVIDEVEKEFSWDSVSDNDKVISIKIGIDRGVKEIEYGPYTKSEIKRAYAEKRINDKTLVFIPGMKEWLFLADTPLFSEVEEDELPPTITDDERRLNQRKPFVARMFYHDNSDVFEGICRDISLGGMQILVSDLPIQVGDEIKMNVHPDNDSYNFVATGLIVRVLGANQGFAIRFVDLNEEAESAINNYILEQ